MSAIFDLHQMMRQQHLILVYEGDFTQDTTRSILAMAERNLDAAGEDTTCKRKVFNVMVECLQNIVKHNDPVAESFGHRHPAIFMIGREEHHYAIMSGNPIARQMMSVLESKLSQINALDKEGLKELYKSIIRSTALSEKGGAGLGFVDMARKSGEKLHYEFSDLDNGHAFFSLTVRVPRGDNN